MEYEVIEEKEQLNTILFKFCGVFKCWIILKIITILAFYKYFYHLLLYNHSFSHIFADALHLSQLYIEILSNKF